MTKIRTDLDRLSRWRNAALASTALPLLLVAAPAAFAQPAANSLPGNFSTAGGTSASYTLNGTSTNAATIAVIPGATASILSWGSGTPTVTLQTTSGGPPPSGVTQNAGMSIGQGASVTIAGGSTKPLLLNDATGSASEIYGTLGKSSTGPLYVANANGIVVGSTGTINTGGNLGLIGYAQDNASFATTGGVTVNSSTIGSGAVTVANGATLGLGGGQLLIAGNGAVNVGVASANVWAIAGYGFTTSGGGDVVPILGSSPVPLSGSTASVSFSGGGTGTSPPPTPVAALYSAGNVTNTGVVDLRSPAMGYPITINGTFTNSGVAYTSAPLRAGSIVNTGTLNDSGGRLGAVGIAGATGGADVTNSGTINESANRLILNAGQAVPTGGTSNVPGNVSNTGTIDFTNSSVAHNLYMYGWNVNLAGTIEQATSSTALDSPLSSTNYLAGLTVAATSDGAHPNNSSATYGVVDISTTAYAAGPTFNGQAVRFLSGSVIDPTPGGSASVKLTGGTATDPFYGNASLNYNLSVFRGANLAANTIYVSNSGFNSANPSANLGGVLGSAATGQIWLGYAPPTGSSTPPAAAPLGTINGLAQGGLSLNNGGVVEADFTGNMNNPNGAAFAGQTAFQYNFLPITVATTSSGGAGAVTLSLNGPSSTSGNQQLVNVLVKGNATLATNYAGSNLPNGIPTPSTQVTPNPTYTNNHLVAQATGSIAVGNEAGSFYWPGVVRLATVSSASNPTALSAIGSITLNSNLINTLPAFSTGGTGIFFDTNSLNLNSNQVWTSNKSWVNFANASIASEMQSTYGSQFYGGYVVSLSPALLGLQQLPASDFQPK